VIELLKKIGFFIILLIIGMSFYEDISKTQAYEEHKKNWEENWGQLLEKINKNKSSSDAMFKIIDSELNDFSPHYRKRGLLAILIDRFCEANDPNECSLLVNKYVKKVNNRVLAAMHLNLLSEKNLKKSLDNAYIPDTYYFLLKNKSDVNYNVNSLNKDWFNYMHFLLKNVGVNHVINAGVVKIIESGVFHLPGKFEFCVASNKPITAIDCKGCVKHNEKSFHIKFENYDSWYRSRDIKLEVSKGQELIIKPYLGVCNEVF